MAAKAGRRKYWVPAVAAATVAALAGGAYAVFSGGGLMASSSADRTSDAAANLLKKVPENDRIAVEDQMKAISNGANAELEAAMKDGPAVVASLAQEYSNYAENLSAFWTKIDQDNYSKEEKEEARKIQDLALSSDASESPMGVFNRSATVKDLADLASQYRQPLSKAGEKALVVHGLAVAKGIAARASTADPVVAEALARIAKMPAPDRTRADAGAIASDILTKEPCFGVSGGQTAAKPPNILGLTPGITAVQARAAICVAANQPVLRPYSYSAGGRFEDYCLTCTGENNRPAVDLLRLSPGPTVTTIERLRRFETMVPIRSHAGAEPNMVPDMAPVPLNTLAATYTRQFGAPNFSYGSSDHVVLAWAMGRDGKPLPPNHWVGIMGLTKLNGVQLDASPQDRKDDIEREYAALRGMSGKSLQATFCLANLPQEYASLSNGLPFRGVLWSQSYYDHRREFAEMSRRVLGLDRGSAVLDPPVSSPPGTTNQCGVVLIVRLRVDSGVRRSAGYANAPRQTPPALQPLGVDVLALMRQATPIAELNALTFDAGAVVRQKQAIAAEAAADLRAAQQTLDAQSNAQSKGFRP